MKNVRVKKKKKKTNNRCIGERQLSDLHVIVCISTPSCYTFSVGNQNSSECPKEKKIKKKMGEYIIMLNESPCVKARGQVPNIHACTQCVGPKARTTIRRRPYHYNNTRHQPVNNDGNTRARFATYLFVLFYFLRENIVLLSYTVHAYRLRTRYYNTVLQS